MGQAQNPFAVSMTKLHIPEYMGQSVNVEGFELGADEDGNVEVPSKHVATLLGHGLEVVKPKAAPAVPAAPGRPGQQGQR